MKRIALLFGCLGLLLGTTPFALAQSKPIEWRIHTPHGDGRSEWVIEKEWADGLTKESGGRLKVSLFPRGALGFKDADMLRVVPQGVIEGYLYYPGYIVRDDPILALTSPEMILYQREHFVNYWPAAHEASKQRLSSKWKIRLSVTFTSPACSVGIVGRQPFNTLESMKGKKIRAWEVPQMETLKKLGVPTQMMSQSEVYLALKTGVLDGALFGVSPFLNPMHEVAKYWSTLYQGSMLLGMATSEAAFRALPPDLQAMMQKFEANLMKKWATEVTGWCAQYDDAEFKQVKEKGGVVLSPFPKADQDLLVKAAVEGWRERAKELGVEAVKYQKKLETALSEAKPKP